MIILVKTELIFQAAYGSAKDIAVYQSLGLKANQIYIVGKVSKKQHSLANVSHFLVLTLNN